MRANNHFRERERGVESEPFVVEVMEEQEMEWEEQMRRGEQEKEKEQEQEQEQGLDSHLHWR